MSLDESTGRRTGGDTEGTGNTGGADHSGEGPAGDATATPGSEDGPDRGPVEVTHAPPRAAQITAVAAALVGAGLTTPFTIPSLPFGIAGVVVVVLSVVTAHSIRWLSAGVSMLLVGTLLAGALGGLSTEVALFGVGATVVAWDAGQHGIVLGRQVGREAPTRRNLAVHVAATVFVVTLVACVGYAVAAVAGSGRPAPAVAVVALGIVLLAWTYRR